MCGGCTARSVRAQDYFFYKTPHDDMLDDVHVVEDIDGRISLLIRLLVVYTPYMCLWYVHVHGVLGIPVQIASP